MSSERRYGLLGRIGKHICLRRIAAVLLVIVSTSCASHKSVDSRGSKSISVLMWTSAAGRQIDRELFDEFTGETGITVDVVPAPQSTLRRLEDELRSAPNSLDVVEFDLAWISQLASQLADVRFAIRDRIDDELPGTVESVVVNSRTLGAPFFVDYGLLFYRTDLLQKYRFSHPPASWSELESQARVIQSGERTGGKKDFWSYVWQGDAYEGLTCNALEWQYSQGGGNLIGTNLLPNITNQKTVEAFARASRWVGTISPPGVLSYSEEDSRAVWQGGNAAFMRNWAYAYPLAKADPSMRERFAVTTLPEGSDPHSSVIGGWYLGIPASSKNQENARSFIRYMTSAASQLRRAMASGNWPTLQSAYQDPRLQNSKLFAVAAQASRRAVRRPIASLGALYPCVSDVYAHSVHDILENRVSAGAGTEQAQARIASIISSRGKEGCP